MFAMKALPWLDVVEAFSGVAAITRGARMNGMRAVTYELCQDYRYENILEDSGFLTLLILLLRVRPGGGFWCAWSTELP